MDRFRRARPGGGASKASASTVCQKCLKRGHYSYECKETLQSRPYISRPSRTQQLLNPKLAPKLNTENPNELLRKQGVADEQLARIEEERGRKRAIEDAGDQALTRKRSRSVLSYTSSSVSTISTRNSRSPSRSISRSRSPPRIRDADLDAFTTSQFDRPTIPQNSTGGSRKRQRRYSTSSSSSYDSYSSRASRDKRSRPTERRTRRRHGSFSPIRRGRRRSRSFSTLPRSRSASRRGRRRRERTRSMSTSSSDSYDSRYSSSSRRRNGVGAKGHRRSTSSVSAPPVRPLRSDSRDDVRLRNRGAKPKDAGGKSGGHGSGRERSISRSPYRRTSEHGRGGDDAGERRGRDTRGKPSGRAAPPPRKERSLSPYSKRLAMTRAMNKT